MSHEENRSRLHLVLGNGAVGRAVVEELAARKERVRVVSRGAEPLLGLPLGVETVRADLLDAPQMERAARGATHVYNCTNARDYHRWPEQFPPLQRGALHAARTAGAVLVAVENLYVYGPHGGVPMTEDLPMRGVGSRSSTRVAMTRELDEAHRRGDVRTVRARASDLFGPRVQESMAGARLFGPVIAGARSVSLMGSPDLPHSVTFVRDFARALVTLGADPAALGRAWHVPSLTLTPRALIAKIAEVAGVATPAVRSTPRALLPLVLPALGLFVPPMRGIEENVSMFYEPFVVDHTRYAETYGEHTTPLEAALHETVQWYRAQLGAPTAVAGRVPA